VRVAESLAWERPLAIKSIAVSGRVSEMPNSEDLPRIDLLQALLEHTSDFIMIADAEAKPVAFNRAYAQIMNEALGIEMRPGLQPHKHLQDPAAIAYWDGLHQRVLGGEHFTIEYTQEFPGVGPRCVQVTFSPIERDGRIVGFCELSREITEQVATMAALAENERILRESQEVARIGSYRLDVTTGRWTSSKMLDEIFGIDADYPRVVENWSEILHPDWREEMVRYFAEEVLGRRVPFDHEYQIVRRSDGAERWVHGLGRLELDADGDVVAMIGTIRDITERKELEDRLRQKEKLEAIGRLAGGIAHDFNNQLVAVLGFADLIRMKVGDDPGLARWAENIVSSARRAADLTGQLLAFSRKGKYQSVAVDLHHLIGEVAAMLRHTMDRRIAIRLELRAVPSMTLGDPSQLQSALLNLALNARDAMPDGGEMTFQTEVVELGDGSRVAAEVEPGHYVRLGVSDTGVGIAPELREHIFEPFFTTKGVGQGTGMGLAAVYGTAQSHRGAVVVESELGKGARFDLYLPLARGAELPVEEKSAAGPARAARIVHVLLVDDEPSVLEASVAILESCGHRVTTAADGAEAVRLFRERWREIDVVVLDVIMPVMGGREAFLAMREIDPGVRVLVVSGYGLEGGARALLAEGVKAVVQKPFRYADFVRHVEKVLLDD